MIGGWLRQQTSLLERAMPPGNVQSCRNRPASPCLRVVDVAAHIMLATSTCG